MLLRIVLNWHSIEATQTKSSWIFVTVSYLKRKTLRNGLKFFYKSSQIQLNPNIYQFLVIGEISGLCGYVGIRSSLRPKWNICVVPVEYQQNFG